MHNLGTVIRFEVVRTIKKKTFWLTTFAFPLLLAALFAMMFFSTKASSEATAKLSKAEFSIRIKDDSGKISRGVVHMGNVRFIDSKDEGIELVRSGKVDAFFHFPKNIAKDKVDVYGKETSLFENGRYNAVAQAMLSASVLPEMDQDLIAIVTKSVQFNTKIYKEGKEYDGFKEMILPGLYLVVFYIVIGFFGNQMLVSTTEEKENRIIEMLLTTIEAKTLIIGKILAIIAVSTIQLIAIVAPILIAMIYFPKQLNLPNIDFATLVINWERMGIGLLLFGLSFMLFTGILIAVGSAVPTAKEANSFLGVVFMLIFGPLYAASLFITSPSSTIVTVLTLFPLTAPIPLLLRNAVGNLTQWEIIASVVIMTVCMLIMLKMAVKIFEAGTLEYSQRLSWKRIFGKG